MAQSRHWTAESNDAFVHRISSDFLAQLENRMEAQSITQGALARKLGVSEGAVSHILNNPQNLTLKTIVAYARALDIKVSIVAYDDDDPHNERGPVDSEIFSACWENAGKPLDFWSLKANLQVTSTELVLNSTQVCYPLYFPNYVVSPCTTFTTQAIMDLGPQWEARLGGTDVFHLGPELLTRGSTEAHA